MKKFLLIASLMISASPAMADNPMSQLGARMITTGTSQSQPVPVETVKPEATEFGSLKRVEPKLICMMNNKFMGSEQIPIEVEGRTYYGCCPMCAKTLKTDSSARTATDPVSSKSVDKAAAVIGADKEGKVYYFENEENLKTFGSKDETGVDMKSIEP
jgi:YHS domain-containing protein